RDKSLEERIVVAEEEVLARQFAGVIRLSPQKLGRGEFGFWALADAAERGRQRRKGAIGGFGLARRLKRKSRCCLHLAERETRPGANVVKAPDVEITRAEHGRAIQQGFRIYCMSGPQ